MKRDVPRNGLEMESPDFSKFIVRDDKEPYRYRRPAVVGRLSYRVPSELRYATSLSIACSSQACDRKLHNHMLVCINEVELCPISAMLFLAAIKGYRWCKSLEVALKKVLEVSIEG